MRISLGRYARALGVLLLLGAASVQANVSAKQPMELLFVLEAKQATLTHVQDKHFRLHIPRASVTDAVLAFSDRPYKKMFRLTLADYEKLVETGKDSFLREHPNIVLTWGSDHGCPIKKR